MPSPCVALVTITTCIDWFRAACRSIVRVELIDSFRTNRQFAFPLDFAAFRFALFGNAGTVPMIRMPRSFTIASTPSMRRVRHSRNPTSTRTPRNDMIPPPVDSITFLLKVLVRIGDAGSRITTLSSACRATSIDATFAWSFATMSFFGFRASI